MGVSKYLITSNAYEVTITIARTIKLNTEKEICQFAAKE